MGKSLAEVHALERARWDALVPETVDPAPPDAVRERRSELPRRLLASAADFLGDLRGRRLLELGCGLGDLTLELARAGARVTAIDLSPRSVDYLRRRAETTDLAGTIETRVSAAERLPLFDESFELALGHRVLACLEPELAAPELHRVLRPGGRALFCEPLRDPLLPRLRLGRRGAPEDPGPTPDLACWTQRFAGSEVRLVRLPPEPGAASGGWRRLSRSWLARIPALRPDRPHRLLLLTR